MKRVIYYSLLIIISSFSGGIFGNYYFPQNIYASKQNNEVLKIKHLIVEEITVSKSPGSSRLTLRGDLPFIGFFDNNTRSRMQIELAGNYGEMPVITLLGDVVGNELELRNEDGLKRILFSNHKGTTLRLGTNYFTITKTGTQIIKKGSIVFYDRTGNVIRELP